MHVLLCVISMLIYVCVILTAIVTREFYVKHIQRSDSKVMKCPILSSV